MVVRDEDQPIPRWGMGAPSFFEGDGETLLCHCREVSTGVVRRFIEEERPGAVWTVSRATGAGTACGSCRPLIAHLIREMLGVEPDLGSPSSP